jgi:hypothetical protein
MRDGDLKYLPVAKLIEILSRLPEGYSVSARTRANTGNLVVHNALLDSVGYIEFNNDGEYEQF